MAKEQKRVLGKGLGALFGDDLLKNDLTRPGTEDKDEAPKPPARPASDASGDKARAVRALLDKQSSPAAEPAASEPDDGEESRIQQLAIDDIASNPWQPRQRFDEDALTDLTESIRSQGILSPLLVARRDDGYILVAGERRLRAAKAVGLREVPAIVRPLSEAEIAQIALIENIQRADLNALEEARGYAALIDRYSYTQQQLAGLMGKSRPYVANLLRLLELPPVVMKALEEGSISAGHARALLSLPTAEEMERLAERIVAEGLSVRTTEEIVRLGKAKATPRPRARQQRPLSPLGESVVSALADAYDTRVTITEGRKKGRIVIEFAGSDDLQRIADLILH